MKIPKILLIIWVAIGWILILCIILFFFWNPFGWNIGDITPDALGDSFWVVNSLVSIITLLLVYATFIEQKNINEIQSTELNNQSQDIRNQNFRNMLHSMLLGLKESLNNISGVAFNPAMERKTKIYWKEAFFSLDVWQIYYNWGYYTINAWDDNPLEKWLNEWWKENIENIIFIIKQIEEYIDASKASIDRKEFYFSLLRSYLWVSELRIIQEVLKDMSFSLKTCKQ